MSTPRKMTLETVMRACAAHEALGGAYQAPDKAEAAPLELSVQAKWNAAKNLRVLRAEREAYNEQVRAIATEEIKRFYPSGKVPEKDDQTDVDRAQIQLIDAAYGPRVRDLNNTETEIAGLLDIPYAGLNLDKNRNFPLGILPDLFDFIAGGPDEAKPEEKKS